MRRKRYLLLITFIASILIAGSLFTGCSSTTPVSQPDEPPSAAVQSNSGGSVTIEARLLGHQNDTVVFEISMDTHSVELDGYDLKQLTVLRDDKGGTYLPTLWDSAPGGHHRKGTLVFAHTDRSVKTLELIIKNVAGVNERVLRWQGITE